MGNRIMPNKTGCSERRSCEVETTGAGSLIRSVRHTRMRRDIDHIIERLTAEMPGVQVRQLQVSHPGTDDDGLWFVTMPGSSPEVELEVPHGGCPFLIESDFSAERFHGRTIDEVVSTVRRLHA